MKMSPLVVAISLVTSVAACMPTYHFERPPLGVAAATATEASRCYEAARFALVAGRGTWIRQHTAGDWIISETWGSSGLGVYRGDHLLPTEAALGELSDRELGTAYHLALASDAHDHAWYPRYVWAMAGLSAGALALEGVALGLTLQDPTNLDRVIPPMAAGVGAALLAIVPAVLASRSYDGAVRYDLQRTMFTHGEWGQRMVRSVRAANRRVADRCQYGGDDTPISDGARQLVGDRP